jgi:outer membrane autotransporter protein
VSTERIVSLPGATSRLTASFGASGFGARIEGGRRFVVAKLGVTPFVAVQGQTVHTPAYTEQGVGAPFALAYGEQDTSRLRSELGTTFDAYVGEIWGGSLSMYWRMAWAHNYWRDNSINALFPVLPGAGFTVFGATAPADSLLLASGAEYRWGNGLSIRGKLEAELANSATTFAASATFRASW